MVFDLTKISRLDVVDENGIRLTEWNVTIEYSVQDNGRTLKLFIKKKKR